MLAPGARSAGANPQNIAASLEPLSGFLIGCNGGSGGHEGTVPGALPSNTYLVGFQAVQGLGNAAIVAVIAY